MFMGGSSELADFLGDGNPDPLFLEEANKLFPTGTRAINALRRIGKPRIGSLDSSNPSKEVGTFMQILASLGTNIRIRAPQVTSTLVKDNWSSLLAPWTFFVLEELVLNREPQTPAGWFAFNTALWTIPFSLYTPLGPEKVDLQALRELTPRLPVVCSRVWFKTVDLHHFTWGAWSMFLANLLLKDLIDTNSRDSSVFDIIRSAGAISIRHIHREISHIPTMTPRESWEFHTFLMFLNPELWQGRGPLVANRLSKSSLQGLTCALSGFLYNRRKLGQSSSTPHDHELSTVMAILGCIDWLMAGNLVSEAVEAGLVVILLKGYPYNFSSNTQKFDVMASTLLERIAQYLIFPSVLHHFLRSANTIIKSRKYEQRLREKSEVLWNVWERTKIKAFMLRDIRNDLKRIGRFWKCSNNLCDGSNARDDQSFLRCAGCLGVTYCSKSCRKSHWRASHRGRCEEMHKYREEGILDPSMTDQCFFLAVNGCFMESHDRQVAMAVKDYITALSSSQRGGHVLSEEQQLIINRVKNPIIVVDHTKPGITQMSDCVMVDSEELVTRFEKYVGRERLLYLTPSSRGQNLDATSLYIVVLLPMGRGKAEALSFRHEYSQKFYLNTFKPIVEQAG